MKPLQFSSLTAVSSEGIQVCTDFMQGQFSGDFSALQSSHQALTSARLSRQGRVVALVEVVRLEEDKGFELWCEASVVDLLYKSLLPYAAVSRATLAKNEQVFLRSATGSTYQPASSKPHDKTLLTLERAIDLSLPLVVAPDQRYVYQPRAYTARTRHYKFGQRLLSGAGNCGAYGGQIE